jgi:hypothetical protein
MELAGQNSESEALVESDSSMTLRVHQKRECRHVSLQSSAGGISQERHTQATALKSLVHGETPDANGGHSRVTRQTSGFGEGKIIEPDTRGGKGVICANVARGGFNSHETIRDPATDVLGNLRLKITIKHIFAWGLAAAK